MLEAGAIMGSPCLAGHRPCRRCVFEAAGRLLSMALAAAELNLTPGAISRQIRTLEEDLGAVLFRRMTRRIALTEEGSALHQVVSRALAELTSEAERLRALEAVMSAKVL
jgi:LysR family glycine cleavage system transcriptional activator